MEANSRKNQKLANEAAEPTASSRSTQSRSTRSRFTPEPNAGMRLEERDRKLLSDLFLHRLMSRRQIQALYFTSLPRCNARLRQLFDHGFLTRFYPPVAPFGAQAIYSLGKAAVPVVARELDMDMPEVRRQLKRSETPTFIEHTLAIVDVWLAFREAVISHEHIEIERWLPEVLCRHEYDLRESGTGRWQKEVFKPDAFVRLWDKRANEYSNFFIEVDLGHTSSRQFVGKLLAHQRYGDSGLFREIYGGDSFKTLVFTTSERRVANLCDLVSRYKSNLFWFTTFESARPDVIGSAIWTRPEQKNPSRLLIQQSV